YYRLITSASEGMRLTIDHAQLTLLSDNLKRGAAKEHAAVFADHIDCLRAAGATVAAVTSVAGHFCIDELLDHASLPVVSILDSIDAHLSKLGYQRVGLLGNRLAMESRLFGKVTSTELIVPAGEQLSRVGEAYAELARTGVCTNEQRTVFVNAAEDLTANGAGAVLLGGTDLFLAFQGEATDYPVVDAAQVHVTAILARSDV
ncbi:MAG: aspartate/glutamate racemase family protein, partial [Pseudomonadota bacterium]